MGENVTAESITTRDCNGQRPPLPPNGGPTTTDHLTPCRLARSFSTIDPESRYPTDPETGLPYPLRFFGLAHAPEDFKINDHHPHYRRRDPDLEGDLSWRFSADELGKMEYLPTEQIAGIALRVSRVYRASQAVHALAHKYYPHGPEPPHDVSDKFAAVMKNLAHIMPRAVYDPTAPEGCRITPMTNSEYMQQATTSWVHPERYALKRPEGYQARILSLFFARYVGAQNTAHLASGLFDEFLSVTNEVRRQKVGHVLLREAALVSVAPLQKHHSEYRRKGLILSDRYEHPDLLVDVVMHYLAPAQDIAFKIMTRRFAA